MLLSYLFLLFSNWLVCKFSSKSKKILVLGLIYPNLVFEEIIRCLCQIRIQQLQIDQCTHFQINLIRFYFDNNCLNLDFRNKILKYQCQILIQHIHIDQCENFQVNLTRFLFWDHCHPNFHFNGIYWFLLVAQSLIVLSQSLLLVTSCYICFLILIATTYSY